MLELLRKKKSLRILIVAGAAIAALAGAVYLYFHNPHSYPLPCVFYSLTGFYCPGCGAGRASYSLLHGRFLDAFCYNPVMTVLLPLLALYVAARAIDWAITGGDHIDQKISVKFVAGILIFVLLFGTSSVCAACTGFVTVSSARTGSVADVSDCCAPQYGQNFAPSGIS